MILYNNIIVLSEKEILLEKIRTILERNKARDIYDLYCLILRKNAFSKGEIEKKLNKKFNFDLFKEKFLEKNLFGTLN